MWVDCYIFVKLCKYNAFLFILQLFSKISSYECIVLLNFYYLCSDLGEKSRVADALAFISHFTEKTSEIYFGISSIEKQGKSETAYPPNALAMHTPMAWSILIC